MILLLPWIILAGVLLLVVGMLAALLLTRQHQKYLTLLHQAQLTQALNSLGERDKLVDKLVTLLSTKDPLSFQQVQAMSAGQFADPVHDPSDEGEVQRIKDRTAELLNDVPNYDADGRAALEVAFAEAGLPIPDFDGPAWDDTGSDNAARGTVPGRF